jgi:hypothetical protein
MPEANATKKNSTNSSSMVSKSIAPQTQNAIASRALVGPLTPLFPKDDKEATGSIEHLYALVKTTMLTFAAFIKQVGKRGQEIDHCRSQQSVAHLPLGSSAMRVGTKEPYMTSFRPRTCEARSRTTGRRGTMWIGRIAMKETTTCMARIMTSPLGTAHPRGIGTWEESSCSHATCIGDLASELQANCNQHL